MIKPLILQNDFYLCNSNSSEIPHKIPSISSAIIFRNSNAYITVAFTWLTYTIPIPYNLFLIFYYISNFLSQGLLNTHSDILLKLQFSKFCDDQLVLFFYHRKNLNDENCYFKSLAKKTSRQAVNFEPCSFIDFSYFACPG